MSETSTKTALATLDSLEARLQKVQWYLSGDVEVEDDTTLREVTAQGHDYTVQNRIARLENGLGKLSSRSPVVRDLLQLRPCCFSSSIGYSQLIKEYTNRCLLS